MRRRYVVGRPKAMLWSFDERDCGDPMSMDYLEDKPREPQDTGLLDAHGMKLYRVEAKEPVGFRLGERK